MSGAIRYRLCRDGSAIARHGSREGAMESVVGVFALRQDGERAVRQLAASGFRSDRITLLTPRSSAADIQSVPTTEA